MDKRTELEKECQEVLLKLRDALTGARITRPVYMELIGLIRTQIQKIENKQYVCITGRHAGVCQCK